MRNIHGASREVVMFVPASAIDATLSDSFPASDPPSWNRAIVRLCPPGVMPSANVVTDVIDVSRPHGERTFLQALVSLAAAVGIALLVPFVILLLVAPMALAVRAVVGVIAWLMRLAA
jgi:hypothetical protein